MLNADSQNAVGVWGYCVTQFPAAPFSGRNKTKMQVCEPEPYTQVQQPNLICSFKNAPESKCSVTFVTFVSYLFISVTSTWLKHLGGVLAVTSLWQQWHNVTSNTYNRRRSTYLPLFLDMPPEMQRLLIKRKTGQLVWLPNWQAHVWWLNIKRCHTHTYIYETDAACSTDWQVLEPMNLHDGITSWVFIDTTLP